MTFFWSTDLEQVEYVRQWIDYVSMIRGTSKSVGSFSTFNPIFIRNNRTGVYWGLILGDVLYFYKVT